jgi:hypothetical protein
MEPPCVVSYENAPSNENTAFFFETCRRNGWNLIHVGAGEEWRGFMNKIIAYKKVCDELADDRLVVFSDARDVFCVRPPKAFRDGFASFGRDIVVSTEIFSDTYIDKPDDAQHFKSVPLHAYYRHHGLTPGIRKYINSGLIAGKAAALRHMWTWILEQKFNDDQFGIHVYANTFPERISLDADAALLHSSTFAVNAGVEGIHIQKHDSPTFAELLGCGAFFLHIPGISIKGQARMYDMVKTHLQAYTSDLLLKMYNYPIPEWNEIF